MVGAYSMTTQVMNDGKNDSVLDRKQMKIYTADNFMMYASPNITDSFANFGIGKYEVKDGMVYEHIFYSSANGSRKDTFTLAVEKRPGGYKQVIENIPISGNNYKLTEEYDKTGSGNLTPLDGAWKQTKNIFVSKEGDSTINDKPSEYKIFQAGYFIWAITIKDSANNRTSVFGYGPYEMVGNNKSRETIVNATFVSSSVGRTYEVDIEFPTPDSYKQTITFANGEKSIEIYEKLK